MQLSPFVLYISVIAVLHLQCCTVHCLSDRQKISSETACSALADDPIPNSLPSIDELKRWSTNTLFCLKEDVKKALFERLVTSNSPAAFVVFLTAFSSVYPDIQYSMTGNESYHPVNFLPRLLALMAQRPCDFGEQFQRLLTLAVKGAKSLVAKDLLLFYFCPFVATNFSTVFEGFAQSCISCEAVNRTDFVQRFMQNDRIEGQLLREIGHEILAYFYNGKPYAYAETKAWIAECETHDPQFVEAIFNSRFAIDVWGRLAAAGVRRDLCHIMQKDALSIVAKSRLINAESEARLFLPHAPVTDAYLRVVDLEQRLRLLGGTPKSMKLQEELFLGHVPLNAFMAPFTSFNETRVLAKMFLEEVAPTRIADSYMFVLMLYDAWDRDAPNADAATTLSRVQMSRLFDAYAAKQFARHDAGGFWARVEAALAIPAADGERPNDESSVVRTRLRAAIRAHFFDDASVAEALRTNAAVLLDWLEHKVSMPVSDADALFVDWLLGRLVRVPHVVGAVLREKRQLVAALAQRLPAAFVWEGRDLSAAFADVLLFRELTDASKAQSGNTLELLAYFFDEWDEFVLHHVSVSAVGDAASTPKPFHISAEAVRRLCAFLNWINGAEDAVFDELFMALFVKSSDFAVDPASLRQSLQLGFALWEHVEYRGIRLTPAEKRWLRGGPFCAEARVEARAEEGASGSDVPQRPTLDATLRMKHILAPHIASTAAAVIESGVDVGTRLHLLLNVLATTSLDAVLTRTAATFAAKTHALVERAAARADRRFFGLRAFLQANAAYVQFSERIAVKKNFSDVVR